MYHFTSDSISGQTEPVFDGTEWVATIQGWNARAPTKTMAALLAFAAWCDALPPECADRVWFVG
jgi:hypothetical protein